MSRILDAWETTTKPAILALANGSFFKGISVGASGATVGEVVFNTSMTGYQEILTDPSYAEQIVTLTYPHIGNVGVNDNDREATTIWAKGLIMRHLSPIVSNWRATDNLSAYLIKNNVIAIAEIDTRRLTKMLRDQGAQNGCILTEDNREKALQLAREFQGLENLDLAKVVSTQQVVTLNPEQKGPHVVVYDFGCKQNILNLLLANHCRVTLVPAQTPAAEILKLNPDGILLANGPGDPAACDYAIKNTQILMQHKLPIFGICLGFQILALANGAKTYKMKFGHHGANHPVKDEINNHVYITSQNHGFAVDEKTLADTFIITQRSLFDNTIQGFKHRELPIFGVQGHPEASPGPHDASGLFQEFVSAMRSVVRA